MSLPKHLTYANVASTLALSLALGGGAAVAAVTLAPNSVKSGTIVDGQVKAADIGTGAVTGAKVASSAVTGVKVADGSLSGADLAANTLTGAKVANGSLGGADLAPDTLTGAQIDELSLGKVNAAAAVDSLTPVRMTLAEGDVSNPILFERGDWRLTATCLADGSGFSSGKVRLEYRHADDGTRASVAPVNAPPVMLRGDSGSGAGGTSTNVIDSDALMAGGQFFATDDAASSISGLVSVRIPKRDGAYSGPSECQFDLVVLG